MRIKTVSVKFGELRLALEEVAITPPTVVGALAVVVVAIFLWAVM